MLFRPLRLGGLALANRLVMAPMTRQFARGGVHDARAADYYRRRAAVGIGLLISEGTSPPHPLAAGFADVPALETEAQQASWRQVADAVRAEGAAMLIQLWHVGMLRDGARMGMPDRPSIGPSGTFPGQPAGKAMDETDIADVIEAFARAAETVERLGFGGVELHAGHGYLFDQFFWSETNRRIDRYGGGVAARTRFAVETIAAIRARTRPGFVVSLRISQFKPPHYEVRLAHSPQELEAFLGPLADAGIDVFHASTRRFWLPEFEGSDRNLAGWIKHITGMPVISVGSLGLDTAFDPRSGVRAEAGRSDEAMFHDLADHMERGDFDLIAIGRSLLANPAWGRIIRDVGPGGLEPYTTAAVDELY
jgi:2,4-dienoyl-CoA reductase-like NADH-dependent reductase (Old Yellow Enzyme family)